MELHKLKIWNLNAFNVKKEVNKNTINHIIVFLYVEYVEYENYM